MSAFTPASQQLTQQSQILGADDPPRPTLSERPEYVARHPSEHFIIPLLRAEIEGCLARVAGRGPGGMALDIGCGRQPFRPHIEAMGLQYIGLDVQQNEDDLVDVIGQIDGELPPQLTQLPPFRFLLCTEVMEHVARWDIAFRNMSRLLAAGGLLLITAPQFYQLHEEPYDFWRPTVHAIDTYARQAGFCAVYRKAAGDAWDVLGTVLGSFGFTPRSERILDRIFNSACWRVRRLLLWALQRRLLQRRLNPTGSLYLSNVFLLEKVSH